MLKNSTLKPKLSFLLIFLLISCSPQWKEEGYLNKNEFDTANNLGFDNSRDYYSFVDGGFDSKDEWSTALASGFKNAKEFNAANKFGLGNYADWINFNLDSKDKGYFDINEYGNLLNAKFLQCYSRGSLSKGSLTNYFLHIGDFKLTDDGYINGFMSFETLSTRNVVEEIVYPTEDGYSPRLAEPDVNFSFKASKSEKNYRFRTYADRSTSTYTLNRDSLELKNEINYGSGLKRTWSYECKPSSKEEYLTKRKKMISAQLEKNKQIIDGQQKILEDTSI